MHASPAVGLLIVSIPADTVMYLFVSLSLSLRQLDIEFMKHLSRVVNIIPVIAKSDTMTPDEKNEFKHRVRDKSPWPLTLINPNTWLLTSMASKETTAMYQGETFMDDIVYA